MHCASGVKKHLLGESERGVAAEGLQNMALFPALVTRDTCIYTFLLAPATERPSLKIGDPLLQNGYETAGIDESCTCHFVGTTNRLG